MAGLLCLHSAMSTFLFGVITKSEAGSGDEQRSVNRQKEFGWENPAPDFVNQRLQNTIMLSTASLRSDVAQLMGTLRKKLRITN